MLVYKYVHQDRIDILENGLVRFSQPAALNDPFETFPNFNQLEESLAERQLSLLTRVGSGLDAVSYTAISYSIRRRVREAVTSLRDQIGREITVLSLTKNRNNLLMWAHYADSHRGFVMGFDASHPFIQGQGRLRSPLTEVKYSAKRPELPPFEAFSKDFLADMIIFTKSEHWSYEEEVRTLAHFSVANNVRTSPYGLLLFCRHHGSSNYSYGLSFRTNA